MDTIYITGHKNPDTDSIVSAMAYAALKNALGLREYKAARLGEISDETRTVLERFHVYAAVLAYHRYRIEANYHPYGLVNIIGANTRRSRVIIQVFIYKG